MKILFEFSKAGLPNYLPAFKTIRQTILDNNHQLTNDLLKKINQKNSGSKLSKKIFKNVSNAISLADCVIIEGSTISLANSYVLTQSITLGKPVLFLNHSQSPEINKSRFIDIIDSKLITSVKYDDFSQLPDIILKFLKNTKYIKTRFNLVLPNELNSFITAESKKENITKTELIIRLIKNELQKIKK